MMLTLQEVGDVLKLWNVVFAVAALALQNTEVAYVLSAGVGIIQLPEVGIDVAPKIDLSKLLHQREYTKQIS